ncbi:MAG: hypothetical protein IT383_11530 [Deltaproteobacteria bacterium]|nr:hypothetical protein [Deltaproteobacteria bacterium]
MRALPTLSLAVSCTALAAAALVGCPTQEGEAEGEGEEGEGEGEAGPEMVLLETHLVDTDVDVSIPSGFALAVRPDGRFAVAYGRASSSAPQVECEDSFGGAPFVDAWDVLVVDEQADGTFRTRVVDSTAPLRSPFVDMVADPTSGALIIGYTGGAVAVGACEACDSRLAVENGDTFTLSTVATDGGSSPTPCRAIFQPVCGEGDCVGLNPGLAINASGQLAMTYVDQHFGFGETDIYKADLEIGLGNSGGLTLESVATDSGSGYSNTVTMTDEGRAMTAYATIGNARVVDPDDTSNDYIIDEGIYASTQQEDGSWSEVLILEEGSSSGRIATAYRAGSGFAIAWRDDGLEQLFLYTSVDNGASWTPVAIEQTSNTGKDPAIAFLSDGTLVAAYSHCKDRDDGSDFCSQAEDGVRIAMREQGGPFVRKTFTFDDEDVDGKNVDMAIAADDTVVVMSFNASSARIVVQRFRKQ